MLINGVSLIDDALDCEKELAIFSCARTNNGKNQSELDVLGDPRTLNTVLTRARRGLVIVGDLLTLVQSEEWREYFLYLSANGLIVNV
jgi:superfamily I DNA and/or RNA helicase